MNYALVLKPSAQKELRHLSKSLQRRLIQKMAELQVNPLSPGSVKLAGEGAAWRVRVGDYRVVYEIDESTCVVFVTIIAHRREVYRRL